MMYKFFASMYRQKFTFEKINNVRLLYDESNNKFI